MRWYARSIAEWDPLDRYLKLFIVLDMFVPANRLKERVRFAHRAARAINAIVGIASVDVVEGCVGELAQVRNLLVHDGAVDERLPNAHWGSSLAVQL